MALGAGLEDVLAVPFSDKLRTQFGQEINRIPFKFAPFDLVSVLRSFGIGKFPSKVDVDFSSARVNMVRRSLCARDIARTNGVTFLRWLHILYLSPST